MRAIGFHIFLINNHWRMLQMTKRRFFSMLAMMFVAVFACFSGADEAAAQCCTYTVDIDANVPASCLPIRIGTRWNAGVAHNTISTHGFHNPQPFTPCPMGGLGELFLVTLDNFGHSVAPGDCACLPSGTTPCKLQVCVTKQRNGCYLVRITNCP